MSGWKSIVFDLDDTLYPERAYVLSGFRAVADWASGALGIPAAAGFAELKKLFEAGVRGDTFDRWLGARGHSPDAPVATLVRVYRDHDPRIDPYPGVPSLLNSLRSRHRLGLLSDGPLEVQRRKLRALGLESLFHAVVFSDQWGREAWKPDPRPYRSVLEKLESPAGESVYVADNPGKDFLGARRAGMASIRVCHPGGLHRHVDPPGREHAPDLTVGSLEQLEAGLRELENRRMDRRP